MAMELPNYDITGIDIVWKDTAADKKILFYKKAFKTVENKKITETRTKRLEIPLWEKSSLTIDEAAAYSGVGRCKLREMTDKDDCPFVLWVGSKRLIRRKKLDEYLDKAFSI